MHSQARAEGPSPHAPWSPCPHRRGCKPAPARFQARFQEGGKRRQDFRPQGSRGQGQETARSQASTTLTSVSKCG
jgi:hypothetical protein